MRQSQVKPGVVAMLSLGRRGAVRVTVLELRSAEFSKALGSSARLWAVQDSDARYHYVTTRQLRPMPPSKPDYTETHGGIVFEYRTLKCDAGRPGQTIDAGDVVIETTLHRLG